MFSLFMFIILNIFGTSFYFPLRNRPNERWNHDIEVPELAEILR